jgi:hypothetical protein
VAPIDEPLGAEEAEKLLPQLLPDAGLGPLFEPPPTGHAATATHLDRKLLPRRASTQDEEDAKQALAVGNARPAALGIRHVLGEERLDEVPQFIRQQRLGHARVLLDSGDSETSTPKPVKRFC